MNHARITHRFSFLRGACVVCVIRRWNERGPSVIVSVCASKAVCAFFEFWTVQNFSDAQLCVGVRNSCVGVRCLCVEYAWLCAGHALAVSAYASELVRNRARPRPSTDAPRSYHAWTAHISRSFHWHPRNESACTWNVHEACVFGRAPSVIHASGVRRMFVEYCTVFARMRRRARYVSDSSVIVSDTCAVHAWFMRDSSVISIPDTPKNWSISRRTSTHKPNLCVICEWFVRDRLCDSSWPTDEQFPTYNVCGTVTTSELNEDVP